MYCKVLVNGRRARHPVSLVPLNPPLSPAPARRAWRLAWWAPAAAVGLLIAVTETAAPAARVFPVGLSIRSGTPDRESALAGWSCVAMTGAALILSGYGCLMLAARGPAGAARRQTAGLFGGALVVVLWSWTVFAAARAGCGEDVLAWLVGAHLPTLALSYGLLAWGVTRLPSVRAGQALLIAFAALVGLVQLAYLPGENARQAAVGFTLHSGLIVACIAARLAIWLRCEDVWFSLRSS
jgi:hypothetical protein